MPDYGLHTKGGVITQKDGDNCTIRTRMPAGILSIEKMRGIADIAEQFGQDRVHLTTRQTIEIPHIHFTDIDKIGEALEANGTPIGSERDEIVNIVACPGNDRCKFANIDSINLAFRIDEKLFGKEMPVKVRISISGCPYACTSPILNEIGIVGRVKPIRTPGLCTGCGQCSEYCKEMAIAVVNGEAIVNDELCMQCGVCIESCPFKLIQVSNRGYLITVGGRRGRHPKLGRELVEVETEDEVIEVIDKLVYWVYRRAWSGRLLSDQLDDINFEKFKGDILESLEV
ncbi:nitrite reductase [Methanoplanus sp. FWC-SCC4]|uniref:Nitrite reductase n=1 Tax=Methanochimaera problematica TaxID=2609417 RepID=A0AA97I4V1_9EURY|nr:4Fe-4S binding protein [Methanoplanus sp. FWC-SCC4]WOF17321.1 nitrite reductase [Methanoplanus sp. FWC-SCC4]